MKTIEFDLTDFLTGFFSIASIVLLILFLLGGISAAVFMLGGDHFFKMRSLWALFIAFVISTVLTIVFGMFSGRKYKFNL